MNRLLILILFSAKVLSAQVHGDTFIKIGSFEYEGEIYKEYLHFKSDSQLVKKQVFFDNGQLNVEMNFQNGIEHGLSIIYNKDGILKDSQNYVNGKINGNWKHWYDTGELEMNANMVNGEGLMTSYYKSGKIKSEERINSEEQLVGISRFWCENGQLTVIFNYDLRIENHESYHCNGNLAQKGKTVDQIYKIGYWETWYENGKLNSQGSYYNHELEIPTFENSNKKIGTWKYYNEQGVVINIEEYDSDGNLIEHQETR